MHLQETESLEAALHSTGIVTDPDARGFYADLWQLIKSAETIEDDQQLIAIEKELREQCKNYFQSVESWIDNEEIRHTRTEWCPRGRAHQQAAKTLRKKFEKAFHRYALCYLHLNRHLILMRKKLNKLTREHEGQTIETSLELTDTTGLLLKRAYDQKEKFIEKRQKLARTQLLLKELDGLFKAVHDALPLVLGAGQADRAYTAFRAELRQGNFETATAMLEKWADEGSLVGVGRAYRRAMMAVQQDAPALVKMLEDHKEELTVHAGMMLDLSEIRLILSLLMSEEERVDQFLAKYNLPYMIYKYQHLLRQGGRLGQVGSLENLLALHTRLASGIARPIKDEREAHLFEENVLNPILVLLESRLVALANIFDQMEITVEQLHNLINRTCTLEIADKSTTP